MKLSIPKPTKPTDWSPLKRALLLPIVLVAGIGFVILVADGNVRGPATSRRPVTDRILYIGDSLSIGKFGDLITDHLIDEKKYSVAFFASCGSSPENWISGEPDYETRCGYRDFTFERSTKRDFTHYKTPKLATLLRTYAPRIVIVQQGTNWMDRPLTNDRIRSITQNFVKEVRESGATVIWIGPPDSSRFSAAKQENIYSLIRGVSSVALINSRPPITSYERGKTGPDGIHYNRESSATWARKVIAQLDGTLAKEPRRSH